LSHPNLLAPSCRALLDDERPSDLGPGTPCCSMRPRLESLSDEELFGPRRVVDGTMAACCRAGLWLLYDFLDESHALSQQIANPTGSYWHGWMHRREPDYGNAKYWFRRVGEHPVYEFLAADARQIAEHSSLDPPAVFLGQQGAWDPFRFVDLCALVESGQSASGDVARRVARVEWRLLFEYCYAQALGM